MAFAQWLLVGTLLVGASLSGCFDSNEAFDTLATMQDRTGRTILSASLSTASGPDDQLSGAETFSVGATDGIGIVLHADMWPDERLELTVLDGAGSQAYRATFGTDSFDERHLAEGLSGMPGTWRLEWQANEDLFQGAEVQILAADGQDVPETATFTEDRGHHFLRLTGTLSGWGGQATVRVVGPSGDVIWSQTVSGTAELRERLDATQGTYRLEVDPGTWTGVVDLRVFGIFQGQG